MLSKTIPTLVLGGSGYVAAEVMRLLLGHPNFRIEAVISTTHADQRVDEQFPHLAGAARDLAFSDLSVAKELIASKRQLAVFSALPHGETAAALDDLLKGSGDAVRVVDMSADFRYPGADQYEAIYGKEHGAKGLMHRFICACPDLQKETPDAYIAHPGCFTTTVVLALAPLQALELTVPNYAVSAVTGSTGAGRQPRAGTHHPERQSALWSYEPLRHRHQAEMTMIAARFGTTPTLAFVPHSGPFARGIHATVFAQLHRPHSAEEIVQQLQEFYSATPFVQVGTRMPSVKEIAGSNRCHIGVAVQGQQLVLTSVIDNLVKGAAGGAVQWMNRLCGLDQAAGLMHPVPGWI
ncbi:MAG: N-acetyl-gamma-glutamyl-phosphate reductase [Chthonomonas sp.]|nr:N-acetyl-gamma-glutamyl-phosphate reductase [Chthonomonas sp.]